MALQDYDGVLTHAMPFAEDSSSDEDDEPRATLSVGGQVYDVMTPGQREATEQEYSNTDNVRQALSRMSVRRTKDVLLLSSNQQQQQQQDRELGDSKAPPQAPVIYEDMPPATGRTRNYDKLGVTQGVSTEPGNYDRLGSPVEGKSLQQPRPPPVAARSEAPVPIAIDHAQYMFDVPSNTPVNVEQKSPPIQAQPPALPKKQSHGAQQKQAQAGSRWQTPPGNAPRLQRPQSRPPLPPRGRSPSPASPSQRSERPLPPLPAVRARSPAATSSPSPPVPSSPTAAPPLPPRVQQPPAEEPKEGRMSKPSSSSSLSTVLTAKEETAPARPMPFQQKDEHAWLVRGALPCGPLLLHPSDASLMPIIHHRQTRHTASRLLMTFAADHGPPAETDGTYLVRSSLKKRYTVVVSVVFQGSTFHYQFQQTKALTYMNEHGRVFGTLRELLAWFEEHEDKLCCRLTQCIGAQ